MPGIGCRIADEQGRDVNAVDQVGVLFVKGPILAKGYWGLEAATAERFNNGWYRTGDLFSVDAEGFYSHHGREDDLFKVNGRWVTPLPVEKAVCEAFPAVAEAVLVPSTGEHDALQPTLFVTAAVADGQSVGSLIEGWLETRFPSHIRPRKVISIDGMPRNHNGKLMRSALIQQAQESLLLEAAEESDVRIISSVAALAPADHVESDGCMAIDRLLPVAKLALERAELQAADIDLIVTLSFVARSSGCRSRDYWSPHWSSDAKGFGS